MRSDPFERFAQKVIFVGSCWIWTGHFLANHYSLFYVRPGLHMTGHRFSYELFVGPIDTGKQFDHLCRIRQCVNPNHLEQVTAQENVLRSATSKPCIHGYRAISHCEICRKPPSIRKRSIKRPQKPKFMTEKEYKKSAPYQEYARKWVREYRERKQTFS